MSMVSFGYLLRERYFTIYSVTLCAAGCTCGRKRKAKKKVQTVQTVIGRKRRLHNGPRKLRTTQTLIGCNKLKRIREIKEFWNKTTKLTRLRGHFLLHCCFLLLACGGRYRAGWRWWVWFFSHVPIHLFAGIDSE